MAEFMGSEEPKKLVLESPLPPPPGADVETGTTEVKPSAFRGLSMIQRWRKEDMKKNGTLALRAMALFFSFISFVVMASNNHGHGMYFGDFEEYRYVLVIAILAMLYTGGQCFIQGYQLYSGKELLHLSPLTMSLIDFYGDQIMAYFLLSSASSGLPATDRMRVVIVNAFTEQTAAAISMSLLAFFAVALSALISGYHLSIQL